jgi:hypothetical protein
LIKKKWDKLYQKESLLIFILKFKVIIFRVKCIYEYFFFFFFTFFIERVKKGNDENSILDENNMGTQID